MKWTRPILSGKTSESEMRYIHAVLNGGSILSGLNYSKEMRCFVLLRKKKKLPLKIFVGKRQKG